jgi:FkbM family methyltransferase
VKKLIRTIQNYFPWFVEAKNIFYHICRTRLGMTHDASYKLIRHLPKRDDELFVDVGGNRGQSIIAFRRFRPDAQIVSFEPNPSMYRWLVERFGDWPRVRIIERGLGTKAESTTIYVPAYRGFSYDGLATLQADHARSYFSNETIIGYDPAKVTVSEFQCVAETLDSFGLAPRFIKIDVEGGEFAVLSGAIETLTRYRPVLMIERFYPDPQIDALLAGLGYRQARWDGSRFVAGSSDDLNMFWMTEADLAG